MSNEMIELSNLIKNCKKCDLFKKRKNIVFGDGNSSSKLLLVGEAPGQREDESGLPFVGKSGILLTNLLEEVGFFRDKNFYITNMIKCRPENNRDPSDDEISSCVNYLKMQIKIIKPKIILCVGRISSSKIIKQNFKVTRDHGIVFEHKGFLLMGTFHPAAILRNKNNLILVKNDLKKLANYI
ncbi:MAG: uracil-DNA glycosylase [Clostridiales bacterium]|nr:uracil-DNA glycosylase [Clostridiales bacterium]